MIINTAGEDFMSTTKLFRITTKNNKIEITDIEINNLKDNWKQYTKDYPETDREILSEIIIKMTPSCYNYLSTDNQNKVRDEVEEWLDNEPPDS